MEPNQQQTDLPQEASPHHVYGNQHFSRDTLIASEGGAPGGAKTIGFSPVQHDENERSGNSIHWPQYVLRARCQIAFVAM